MTTSTVRFGCAMAALLVGCCTYALAADPPFPKDLAPTLVTGETEFVSRTEVVEQKKYRIEGSKQVLVKTNVTNTYVSRCKLSFWNNANSADVRTGWTSLNIEVFLNDERCYSASYTFIFHGGPNGKFVPYTKDANDITKEGYSGQLAGGTQARFVFPEWDGATNVVIAFKLEPANAFDWAKQPADDKPKVDVAIDPEEWSVSPNSWGALMPVERAADQHGILAYVRNRSRSVPLRRSKCGSGWGSRG